MSTEPESPALLAASSCLHALFEAQVRRTPRAVAVRHKGHAVRYADLNARANQLARCLRAMGALPGARVAICIDRSVDMLVGLLAVLKAGAAYVPLDPDYPPTRLRAMLDDCEPVALLTGRAPRIGGAAADSDFNVPRLDVSDLNAPWCALDDGDLQAAVGLTPQHLAYVIYTSGSSGTPKGVMVTHANVVHQLAALQRHWQFGPADKVLQFASISFDVSVQEIFGALLHGASLVLRTDAWLADTSTFWQLCEAHGITVADLPVRFWQLLCEATTAPPPALRLLSVGGELVAPAALAQWFARGAPLPRLYVAYGPTETTINATLACPSADPESWNSIGQALAGYTARIVDESGAPVAAGAIGELLIGGPGVASGYLNRPALTAQRFIGEGGQRVYRSGDLARWRADGGLEFCGRNDFQVKIRGYRVELGEIEARLAACAGVRSCAVLAREDVAGDRRLVAYVVATPSAAAHSVTAAVLRAALLAVLPEHMVPYAYVPLAALPLTPNGKLDRHALPAPDAGAVPGRPYEAPRGALEQTIALIWQELLGLEQVGRDDHFFELGGHSLLVVTLVERLLALGLRSSARGVFRAPTVAALALDVAAHASLAEAGPIPNLIPQHCARIVPAMLPLLSIGQPEIDALTAAAHGGVHNVQDIYPLGPLQEGILFHHRMAAQGDIYLLRSMLAFATRAQLDAFVAAWQQVIDRHDILRSSFHWAGLAEPVQLVQRHARMAVHELPALSLAALRAQSDPTVLRMDLGRAPLMECYVAHTDDGKWTLALVNHHLVADHVALEHIIEEVQLILHGQADLLPPTVPYRHFIAQVRANDSAAQQAFFRAMLADIDAPTAPFGLVDVHMSAQTPVAQVRTQLDAGLARELRTAAREAGMPVAVLFSVAFALVVGRCSGRDEVVFGTVLLGRMQGSAGIDRALGMFINTLPLRVSLGDRTVQAVLRATFERIVGLLDHEQAPLALAQRCSGIAPEQPLFTALLNFRHGVHANGRSGAAQQAWRQIQELSIEDERTNYPITLSVDDLGQDFALTTQCVDGIDPGQFDAHMCTALDELVRALRDGSARPVANLSVLSAGQRDQLLKHFSGQSAAAPRASCVHAPVERRAALTPDAVAIDGPGGQLSYALLNRRANQLARELIAQGAQPGDRIAICIGRSIDMVVGVLAILKAGCAYVPLDPAYPAERLAHMVADSAPAIVLTESALAAGLPLPSRHFVSDQPALAARVHAQADHDLQRHHGGLAYVIYTSGSTGLPKGVAMPHGPLVNLLQWQAREESGEGARTLQFAALGFDVAFQEIFSTLSAGRTLVLIDEATRRDAPALARYLQAQRIDRLFLPFVALHSLAEAATAAQLALPALRNIVTAGEQLQISPALRGLIALTASAAAPHGARLHNHYGPTESHVVTSLTLDPAVMAVADWPLLPSIGRPISNARLYVLDQHLAPVPLGVPGEIYIGGDVLADGYWQSDALTASRFAADPLSPTGGARMYKTGDLGRWQADGTLAYLGRNDFQIKLRGFRVELGEIEARLCACDGVAEAVVVARSDAPGEPRLVAYLRTTDGASVSASALRGAMSASLADYMIPSAFVTVAAFPLTPNGKLDRRALPAPEHMAFAAQRYVEPDGEIEQALAELWAELFALDRIGRNDHFFELGGHSLLAVRLAARLQAHFDVELSLRDIFATPRLADMAGRLLDLQLAQYDSEVLASLAAAA